MNRHLQRAWNELEEATRGITRAELTAHPEGKWSPAEVLEHLSLTYAGTARGLQKCLREGKPRATSASPKQRLATFLITRLGYFPSGRPAPEMARPTATDPDQILERYRRTMAEMDDSIAQCEQRFGRVKVADHPILGPLTTEEWCKFHLAHTRHHAKQVRERRGKR